MSDDLVNYIVQQINAGYKMDQVESHLKSYGYDPKDVDSSVKTAIDMAARSYMDYIGGLVDSGYSLAQIRSSMVSQGYDYRIIDHALEHYHKNIFSRMKDSLGLGEASSQRKQEEQQIRKYAEQGLSYGLTLENIQSNLVSQGHDFHLVHKVINTYRQSHLHIPKQVAFIFVILAVVGSIGFVFLSGGTATNGERLDMQDLLLDLESENAHPTRDLEPGDTLYYSISATQMGFEREFDIDFTYKILDMDGNLLRRNRDTKAVVSNLAGSIDIPSDISPGKYEFKAIADYKGEVEARTSFEFEVVSEAEEPDEPIDEPVDDPAEPIDDDDEDVIPAPDPADDEDDDFDLDPDDMIDEPEGPELDEEIPDITDPDFDEDDFDINDLGKTHMLTGDERDRLRNLVEHDEADFAAYLCGRVNHARKSDECTRFVAQEADDMEICDEISHDPMREYCYLSFADDSTDNSICESITVSRMNSLCRLKILRNKNMQLQDLDDDEYMEKISELYG